MGVIKLQVMAKQDLSQTTDKEELDKKLKRSVFNCYMCKAGYVWIQSQSICAEVTKLEFEIEAQKNSLLACRVALDEATAQKGQCLSCYKNATRNDERMCIQIKRNEETEGFKEKLRQSAKIECDGNCDQSMDDEREQIGKRNDSSKLPSLSELSE